MKHLYTKICLSLTILLLVTTGFNTNAQCIIPTGLFAAEAGGITVLTWNAVAAADNYQVQIEDADGNPEFFEQEFDVFDITYGTGGLGLTTGLNYKFKVRSECSGDNSDYSLYYTFTAGSGGVGGGTTHTINVEDNEFNPSPLNVTVGDIVRFSWDDSAGAHTTTSTSIPSGALAWDKPIDAANQIFDYTVTAAGNYNYKCTFHEAMGMVGSFTATGGTAINNFTSGSNFVVENNMATDEIHITINLLITDNILIRLYNINGVLVKDLINSTFGAGIHSETYSVNGFATGVYLLVAQSGDDKLVEKIVIQ